MNPSEAIEAAYFFMKKRVNTGKWISCWRVIPSGDFPLFDYGYGLLCIEVSTKKRELIVAVTNADDGEWVARRAFRSERRAHKAREQLAVMISELKKVPSEKELNRLLDRWGLFGERT